MKSKTSFFNKMIFRKDITRFWPLWAMQLAIGVLALIAPMMSELSYQRSIQAGKSSEMSFLVTLIQNSCLSPYTMGVSILVAVCVFMYLTKERDAYTIHSFPFTRTTLFVSHYLAGLTILLVPPVVIELLLALVARLQGLNVLLVVMIYLLEWAIQIIFFYSLACVVVMLTGNPFMSLLIYFVLNFLTAGVRLLYSSLAELFVYGNQGSDTFWYLDGKAVKILTPVYNFFLNNNDSIAAYRILEDDTRVLNYKEMIQNVGAMAYYILPAVLFFAVALVLYRVRKLEAAGDMIAFNWGRPVFRVVFVFCASLLFALGVYYLSFSNTISSYAYGRIFKIILGLVAFGTVFFYLLSNMILDKTFFIWKRTSYWRMALFTVLMVFGVVGVRNGQMGAAIPDRDEITGVAVRIQFGDEDYVYQKAVLTLTDTKGIDEIYKQNKAILKYGRNLDVDGYDDSNLDVDGYDDSDLMDTVEITYYTKGENTKNYRCEYPVQSGNAIVSNLEKYLKSRDDVCEMIYGDAYKQYVQSEMYVDERYADPEETDAYADEKNWDEESEQAGSHNYWSWDRSNKKQQKIRNALYEAVCRDIEAGRCDVLHMKPVNCFYVGVVKKDSDDLSPAVQITEKCTETLKVLEKLGCVKYYDGQWEMSSGILGEQGKNE